MMNERELIAKVFYEEKIWEVNIFPGVGGERELVGVALDPLPGPPPRRGRGKEAVWGDVKEASAGKPLFEHLLLS